MHHGAIKATFAVICLALAGIAGGVRAQQGQPDARAQTFGRPLVTSPAANRVSLPWVRTDWVHGHKSRVRLVAGARDGGAWFAGIEIAMGPGWKTYWRQFGEDGGIAPTFEWTGSRNLKAATVLYPAPKRLAGVYGDSIGYKGSVLYPVKVEAIDAAKPVQLELNLLFGVCREICIPAEARLSLTVPPGLAALPPQIAGALAQVPRRGDERGKGDPTLAAAAADLTGAQPSLTFAIKTAGAALDTDLFVEVIGGPVLAMARRLDTAAAQRVPFRISLKSLGADARQLEGKVLRLTMTSKHGSAETEWTVPRAR